MTITNIQRFATSLIALTVLMSPVASLAEHHSKSKEIVVLEPTDLPEQAQMGGESFFLHATNAGNNYLYIEQQQGVRLTVLDVTDPARIKPVSSVLLKTEGSYDFVRPVSDRAELIRYRQNGNVAVLDLTKAKSPEVHAASEIMTAFTVTDRLDSTGLLTVSGPADYAVAAPRDFQVIDFATPSNPQVLTTVKQVAHRLTNDETGTTFLLSNQGLTVIRQPQVEEDYREHEAQLSNN